MLTLFDDQEEILNNLRAEMAVKKAILLQSATGSGKTAIGTRMVQNAVKKIAPRDTNSNIIFTVPRRDLLTQTSKTFTRYGINHSYIANGQMFNPFAQVYIGMVDTMARRITKLPRARLVLVDETHFGADALGEVINYYKKMGAWVIGLSATPWKLNGQGLGIWYDSMVQGKSLRWLIDNKRLSDYRYFYGRTHLDLSQVKTGDGEYNQRELQDFMEHQRVVIGDCVRDYRERCMGRLHIVRCAGIKHSQLQAQAFRDGGIPAVHVDGETPDDEKARIFKAFARRELLVLTFADLLNFGFDLSQASGMDVCIESGSDMKPSKSLAGQMQYWGRMLRYKPYPAIINDHVNNYLEHGLPCSDRVWTLASRSKKKGGEPVPPTKQCPNCMCIHPPAPQCPDCKTVYEINSRSLKEVDGVLEEIDKAAFNARQKKPETPDGLDELLPPLNDEQTLDYLIKYAKNMGYKNPASWAAKELAKRINKEYV